MDPTNRAYSCALLPCLQAKRRTSSGEASVSWPRRGAPATASRATIPAMQAAPRKSPCARAQLRGVRRRVRPCTMPMESACGGSVVLTCCPWPWPVQCKCKLVRFVTRGGDLDGRCGPGPPRSSGVQWRRPIWADGERNTDQGWTASETPSTLGSLPSVRSRTCGSDRARAASFVRLGRNLVI